jgi:hypothetical protein
VPPSKIRLSRIQANSHGCKLFVLIRILLGRDLKQFGDVVDRRITQKLIKNPDADGVGKEDIALIGQDDQPICLSSWRPTKEEKPSVSPSCKTRLPFGV